MDDSPKRILLSGGWGYGNLGDDAILHASLNLLEQRFPSAEIVITSYDPEATLKETEGRYEVKPSFHRLLFGTSAFKQLGVYGKTFDINSIHPLLGRIRNRLNMYWHRMFPVAPLELRPDSIALCKECFNGIDLFVMSGGGYFNNWKESLLSRIQELTLAQECGVRTYIVGQTMDKFDPAYQPILKSLLSKCDGISVRDSLSHDMLRALGIEVGVAPDLVLGGLEYDNKDKSLSDIVFIPSEGHPVNKHLILQAIADVAMDKSYSVDIALTRLYNADVNDARAAFRFLKSKGVSVRLTIPKNFNDVCRSIISAKYVVSRNLHGLILGYIGGACVLSLNDGWKFRGFLQQIGQPDNFVSHDSSLREIKIRLEQMFDSDFDVTKREQIRSMVTDGFNTLFNVV